MSIEQPSSEQHQNAPNFLESIYSKNVTVETSFSPTVLLQPLQPQINLTMDISSIILERPVYEVTLTLNVNVLINQASAMTVQFEQAGIFNLSQFNDTDRHRILGAYCPGVLFPYAREGVSNLLTQAGLAGVYLASVNFDTLYQQHTQQQSDLDSKTATIN